MSRLDKIEWDKGEGLAFLEAHGLEAIRMFAKMIHTGLDQFDDREAAVFANLFALEIEDKVDAIEACFDRFIDQMTQS